MQSVLAWIQSLGPWAGVGFIAAYAAATALLGRIARNALEETME